MSDSTLIQFLEPGQSAEVMNRRQIETFLAEGAISAGDVVALDTSKSGADRVLFVTEAGAVATGNPLAIGVATETVSGSAADPAKVKVVVSGYAANVDATAGTILIGAALTVRAAGEVDTVATTDTAGIFAVALEAKGATVANRVAIHIFKRF